jgi:probable HAF family extracellular repeat protein
VIVTYYTFTTLNDPSAGVGGTLAEGISSNGQIVGFYRSSDGLTHGFLDNGGSFMTLDVNITGAAAGTTRPFGINSTGQVVGVYIDANNSNIEHGFFFSGGSYTNLDVSGATSTEANGINDSGQIVGDYLDSSNVVHGFLNNGGNFTPLDAPGAVSTEAFGISSSGQIVGAYIDSAGRHGFLFNGSTYTTLDDPAAGSAPNQGTEAFGINASGQIVGGYISSDGQHHAFVYSGGIYYNFDDNQPAGAGHSAANSINDAGLIVGTFGPSGQGDHGFLATPSSISAGQIQSDYSAVARGDLPLDQATSVANAINAGMQTEGSYVSGLLSQVADTSIPAVAVEASMYGVTGSSAEITSLVTNFLPAQVQNAINHGLVPQVYACEVVGLAFAFGDENGGQSFSINYGPSNPAMPSTPSGDAAFAQAASSTIFGSAANAHTPDAILGWVSNWESFYTQHGVPGIANPTLDQIDQAARAAAWGDAVGVALAGNLGVLPGQVINFLEDAVEGTAIYSASLAGQPAAGLIQGAPIALGSASASGAASPVELTGVAMANHGLMWAGDL